MKYAVWIMLVAGIAITSVFAQWTQETLELEPGWNAVYLSLQPEPANCDALFSEVEKIQSVWRWNQRFTPVDFDIDPADPLKEEEVWLRWYPSDHPYRALRNMYELQGNTAYMIFVDTNETAFSWTVVGIPLVPSADWFEYQLNLMGMAVDPDNAPSFNEYFSDVPEVGVLPDVDEGEIYEVDARAGGQQIMQPARVSPERNIAYWVLCGDKTDYAGPVSASFSPNSSGIMDFGEDQVEGVLNFKNVLTNQAITLTVTPVASLPAPVGQEPVTGRLPMGYWGTSGTNEAAWVSWQQAVQHEVAAESTWSLPVCVWRNELMTNAAGVYACLLEVKESKGRIRFSIPICAGVKAVEQ